MSVKLTNGIDSINLTPQESISLELKLNVSPYGHVWCNIGDQLYKFGIGDNIDQISVNNEQYKYLVGLYSDQPE